MGFFIRSSAVTLVIWLTLFNGLLEVVHGNYNYKEALTKSIIFLEAQRSGKLPTSKRLDWRGDSALEDGKECNVDLVGGYYDAGDNVKYGLPMAFTITTLGWNAVFYHRELQQVGELQHVMDAIKWGTDYLLKAAAKKNHLWVQVGDPDKDHQCWVRPENMNTPRTVLKIDENRPGTEIAAETAAALAVSSLAFRSTDKVYARRLLNKAKLQFEFARTHKGTFDGECPFYCSYSGYNDELLWAASWLYVATKKPKYLEYIQEQAITASVAEFSWDLKYPGAQVLLTQLFFEGEKSLEGYKTQADSFICSVHPESPYRQAFMTPGGLIHMRDGANTQYVTSASMLFSIYGDILAKHNQKVKCGSTELDSTKLLSFVKQQMDYLLGKNPQGRSYMVGFGQNSPTRPHHRGASVPVLAPDTEVSCPMSFSDWFAKDVPNLHELTGAIVGGPDRNDNFVDERWASAMGEPCTYVNSAAVAPLVKLAASYH